MFQTVYGFALESLPNRKLPNDTVFDIGFDSSVTEVKKSRKRTTDRANGNIILQVLLKALPERVGKKLSGASLRYSNGSDRLFVICSRGVAEEIYFEIVVILKALRSVAIELAGFDYEFKYLDIQEIVLTENASTTQRFVALAIGDDNFVR